RRRAGAPGPGPGPRPPRPSPRQFREQFGLTPMRWLAGQRLLEARRLLEVTDLSVDEVAERCGLGSAVTLRAHPARESGTTPTIYRAAYRAAHHQLAEG